MNPQISWKSTDIFLVILFTSEQTNKQTNTRGWKHYLHQNCGGGKTIHILITYLPIYLQAMNPQISWKSTDIFFGYTVHKQTDKQINTRGWKHYLHQNCGGGKTIHNSKEPNMPLCIVPITVGVHVLCTGLAA